MGNKDFINGFKKSMNRHLTSLFKLVIICASGAALLQTPKSIAAPPNSYKPPITRQSPSEPRPPLFGPGNAARGQKLYYCGKQPCDNNGRSDKAGCSRSQCHNNNFDTDPIKTVYTSVVLHAASKKFLRELATCMSEMYPGIDCDNTQEPIFYGFFEQDFRDLAAFLSSKDENKYTINGVISNVTALPVTIVATSDYLPDVSVKTEANGEYHIKNLAAGDYKIVPKLDKYRFVPEFQNISLDYIQCIDEDSNEATSGSFSHEIDNVNFVQKIILNVPNSSWQPKLDLDKK